MAKTKTGLTVREMLILRNTKHGMSGTPTHRSWKDMRARCNNPKDSDYKDYGGRGILVCDSWNDFGSFLEDLGERPRGHSLDRIDVNGNYEPSNCRWADAKTQANNKRNNLLIEIAGETKTLTQWCEIYEIDRSKVWYRLRQGYAPEVALANRRLSNSGSREFI